MAQRYVIKKSGEQVEYDPEKIRKSLERANDKAHWKVMKLTEEQIDDLVREINFRTYGSSSPLSTKEIRENILGDIYNPRYNAVYIFYSDPDKDGDGWSSSIFAETSRDAGKAWGFDVEQGLAAGDDPAGISHSLSAGIFSIAHSAGMSDLMLRAESYMGSGPEFRILQEKFSALSETKKNQAVVKALINIHDTWVDNNLARYQEKKEKGQEHQFLPTEMLPYDKIKKDALFLNRTLQEIGYEYDDEKIRAAFNELAPKTDLEAAEKVMSYRILPLEIREDLVNNHLKTQNIETPDAAKAEKYVEKTNVSTVDVKESVTSELIEKYNAMDDANKYSFFETFMRIDMPGTTFDDYDRVWDALQDGDKEALDEAMDEIFDRDPAWMKNKQMQITAAKSKEERFTSFDEVLGVVEAGKHADSKSHSVQKPEQDKGSKLGSLEDGPG